MGYLLIQAALCVTPLTSLIAGVVGFIASNLLECLLLPGQRVIGLGNFEIDFHASLDEVQTLGSRAQWPRFCFIRGDTVSCMTAVGRGSARDLDTAQNGQVAPIDEERARVCSSTADERTRPPERLVGVQGKDGH